MTEPSQRSLRAATTPPENALAFSDVERRLHRAFPWKRLALTLGVCILPLGFLWAPAAEPPGPRSQTLKDGTVATLDGSTALDVVSESDHHVVVHLGYGSGRFSTGERKAATLEVEAGNVRIRGIHGRFSVLRPKEGPLTVQVENGSVEVLTRDSVHRVSAGERWVLRDVSEQSVPVAREPEAEPAPLAEPHKRRLTAPRSPSAFDRARTAIRQGRYAEARSEFERFIEESPKDPRAPWASFESGRLAMDHLEDFTGASMAIERAVKMAPGAPFVPDALARQITLLEIAGRYESCFLVKRRYLENYPDGAHVPEVSSACKK